MSETRTPHLGFGRVLGETARRADTLHRRLLADAGTDFESWVTYVLLADDSGAMPREALAAGLALRLEVDRGAVDGILDRLTARSLVATDHATGAIVLTDTGASYFGDVRATVNDATTQLLTSLDPSDIDTAVTVLRAVDERASELLTRGELPGS